MESVANPKSGQSISAPAWMGPLVVLLFFAWGFATVLVDTLIPKLKGLFSLTYAEVMLTQFCFFIAYFLVSLPAGYLISRIGYMRGIIVGLLVMTAGCLLFSPAARMGVYGGFLLALFIMAAGITVLQVAANPLMAILGRPETSHSRLTMAQTANSFGTFVGPFFGAALILSGGIATAPDPATVSPEVLAEFRRTEAAAVQTPFLIIAAILIGLAVVFFLVRKQVGATRADRPASLANTLPLLKRPRVALGTLSIFLYVGAEVAIGSLMANFLMQSNTLGLGAEQAGHMVAFYWGCAMVGRFIGTFVLRVVNGGVVLAGCALGAIAMLLVSIFGSGEVAGYALIGVGLFNSIMFPTIFTLAIEGLGEETPAASGLLCMAIVGGAIIPLMTGALADGVGLSLALLLPAACYGWILLYGLMSRRNAVEVEEPVGATAPPVGG